MNVDDKICYVMLALCEVDIARVVAMIDGNGRRRVWSFIPERLPIVKLSGRTANGRLDRTEVKGSSRAFMCSSKGRSNKIEVRSRGAGARQGGGKAVAPTMDLVCVLYTYWYRVYRRAKSLRRSSID